MAETLCPSCGQGPIPEDSEACPNCHTRFAENPLYRRARRGGGLHVRKDEADLEATRTTLGGITGAVDAHPVPTAVVLVAATFTWVVRCVGGFSGAPEPTWPLALAAAQMGVAMMLLVSAGPARSLAQMCALAQVACGYFAGGPTIVQVGYIGAGFTLMLMTFGEPGDARRWTATGASLAMLAFAVWASVTQLV
ncbi:MAG: hypothetical protein IPJ65_19175 [Archangiaceae bacterium]|nr:hypothetical protein [Archangiaceae bacterium]